MTMSPYSSDELHELHRVLEELIAEARLTFPDLCADDIIERLFNAADHGERNPEKLRAAVFGGAA